MAPEHYRKISACTTTPRRSAIRTSIRLRHPPKDYFFDGSFGIYQNLDNSKVWIFPSMRRGGRMLYGFDVTESGIAEDQVARGMPEPDE